MGEQEELGGHVPVVVRDVDVKGMLAGDEVVEAVALGIGAGGYTLAQVLAELSRGS